MRIRPFRRSDGPALTGLVRALATYEKLTPPTAAAARRLVRDATRGHIHVLVAGSNHTLVGYAIWLLSYSSFLARPTLFLEDIFVLPEHRRAGIGRLFVRRLTAEARRRGCGRMEWFVLDWNKPARNFYRRMGVGEMKDWILCRKILGARG